MQQIPLWYHQEEGPESCQIPDTTLVSPDHTRKLLDEQDGLTLLPLWQGSQRSDDDGIDNKKYGSYDCKETDTKITILTRIRLTPMIMMIGMAKRMMLQIFM